MGFGISNCLARVDLTEKHVTSPLVVINVASVRVPPHTILPVVVNVADVTAPLVAKDVGPETAPPK